MKKCMLIICFLSSFSHIDAGWRDQWIWFKGLFSGISIKRPIITRQKMIIGGVGALAVAGAAWWWLKSPKNSTNKPQDKDPNATLGRVQKKLSSKKSINNPELPQKTQNLNQSIELTINQPEEIKKDQPVFVDKEEMYLVYDAEDFFGIIYNYDASQTLFDVETITKDIKYKKDKISKLEKVKATSIKKVVVKPMTQETIPNQGEYVFVNHILDDTQKVILIGKYISHNGDKVTVLSGSLFYNMELENREYEVSDVFVPSFEQKKIQIFESDVNKETLTKKEEEKKRIKLAQIESELEAAKREKLKLESELAAENRTSSIKQAKNLITQTYELKNFEKLLTEYEKNKNKETKTKLTEEFEKLKSNILEDGEELWESFTERYNNAIGLESE